MIDRISLDVAMLPAALLDKIKAHCRVDHTRDDPILLDYIAAAISTIERKCNVNLNPAEYVVTGDSMTFSGPMRYHGRTCRGWPLPPNNVMSLTIVQSDDPAAPDITADYELWNPDYGGNASSYLVGTTATSLPASAVLSLGVGVTDPVDLAPAFFVLIARLTASIYENREASSELWADTFAEEIASLWRPSA
jgi:hypothetical protein